MHSLYSRSILRHDNFFSDEIYLESTLLELLTDYRTVCTFAKLLLIHVRLTSPSDTVSFTSVSEFIISVALPTAIRRSWIYIKTALHRMSNLHAVIMVVVSCSFKSKFHHWPAGGDSKYMYFQSIHVWCTVYGTQSKIIGAVRGAQSQLWRTIIPVCSPHAPRKYTKRFGKPAIVWFTGWN